VAAATTVAVAATAAAVVATVAAAMAAATKPCKLHQQDTPRCDTAGVQGSGVL
jgi:Spy/CpxP family protein refolding chaperone